MGGRGGTTFYRMVREGCTEEVTFEQRHEEVRPIVHGITNNWIQLSVHAYTAQKGREVRIHKALKTKASTQALNFHDAEGPSRREVTSH